MSDRYKAFFEEARNSGVDPEWISKAEEMFEASPLRQDLNATKEQHRQTQEQNSKLRDALLAERFKDFGVTISPTALRIPDDLDPTDGEKVEGWLVQSGLTQSKPTTSPDLRATHDRISAASNEGGQPTISLEDLDPETLSEDEFYRKAAALQAARNK